METDKDTADYIHGKVRLDVPRLNASFLTIVSKLVIE